MTRTRGVFAAAFALSIAAGGERAAAETAALTLGEGAVGGLRLDRWPANGWAVQQYQNLVEIRFPGEEFGISASDEALIALEGRLQAIESDVRQGDTYLRLTLGCACEVTLRGDAATGLDLRILGAFDVIDVASQGPAPVRSPLPVRKARPEQHAANGSQASADDADLGPLDAEAIQERILTQLVRAADAGLIDFSGELAGRENLRRGDAVTNAAPQGASAELGARTDGGPVVDGGDAVTRPATTRDDAGLPAIEPLGDIIAPPTSPDTSELAGEPSVEVSDPERGPDERGTAPSAREPMCFPAEAFALPEHVGGGVFSQSLSDARQVLVGEFDLARSDAGLGLARAYLGAEAPQETRAVLAQFAPNAAWTPLYEEIAAALEGRPLGPDASLRRADCLGDQALWRAYLKSREGKHADALADEQITGRALERLPFGLRQTLAARLGLSAVELSRWEDARRLEAVATRAAHSGGRRNGETKLLSAELAQWHGDVRLALSHLKSARAPGGVIADAATLRLAELFLESPDFVTANSAALRTDLGEISFRMRGEPIGEAAFEKEARLLYRTEGRDALIEFLSYGVEAGLMQPEAHVPLLSELLANSALSELSRPLGLIYLESPERFTSALEQEPFRHALLRSLAEMEVPALALPLVEPGDLDRPEVAGAIAQAFLEAQDPRQALEIAHAMAEDARREELIAAALLASERPEQARDHIDAVSKTISDDGRSIDLLERELLVAASSEDYDRAVAISLELLAVEPTEIRAERALLFALTAGLNDIPPPVREVFATQAPDRLAALELLFRPPPGPPDPEQRDALAEYLRDVDAQMSLIEDYLADG